MPDEKHPLDVAAEQLQAASELPAQAQDASPDFWEVECAMDESVGDYPQALSLVNDYADDSDGIGTDGFPMARGGLPELLLQPTAKWTDVLSSSLWSEGYLFSQRALETFNQFSLGDRRDYPAPVRDATGAERPYTYRYFRNDVDPASIDFERSEFYIQDILGIPKCPIEINSFDEWLAMHAKVEAGELEGVEEFSSLDYKKLFFQQGHSPAADLFTFPRLGIRVYISTRLKDAITSAGITGLEIKPNSRVFAD